MTEKHIFVGVRTKVRRYIQNLTKKYRERSVVRFPLGTRYRADSLRTGIKIFSDKSFQTGARRGTGKSIRRYVYEDTGTSSADGLL